MIFPENASNKKIAGSEDPPEDERRVSLSQTVEAIIKMQMPKISLNLINKIQRSQKTYSCLTIFGDNLYVGTRSSKLYMYKVNGINLEDQKFINPHCEVVSSVVSDQRYFITIPQSDDQSQICIWQTKKAAFLTAFKGHKSQISKGIFMRETGYIATASWDGTARIWSLENLQSDEHFKLYKGTYPILQLQEINREVLAFGGDDCYLIFWNWRKEQVIHKVFGHAGSVTYIYSFFPYLLTCGGDNKFKVWEVTQQEVESNAEMRIQDQPEKSVSDVQEKKLSVKQVRADKEQYDSSVFCIALNQTEVFVIDRQGQSFLCNRDKTYRLTNQFEYNQNVSGISRIGNRFFISTTKGCIKIFDIRRKRDQPALVQQNNANL